MHSPQSEATVFTSKREDWWNNWPEEKEKLGLWFGTERSRKLVQVQRN